MFRYIGLVFAVASSVFLGLKTANAGIIMPDTTTQSLLASGSDQMVIGGTMYVYYKVYNFVADGSNSTNIYVAMTNTNARFISLEGRLILGGTPSVSITAMFDSDKVFYTGKSISIQNGIAPIPPSFIGNTLSVNIMGYGALQGLDFWFPVGDEGLANLSATSALHVDSGQLTVDGQGTFTTYTLSWTGHWSGLSTTPTGNDVVSYVATPDVVPVPEPASLVFVALAGGALLFKRR